MPDFLIALQFLTAIPVKPRKFDEKSFARSVIYFPAVGLLLAGILSCLNVFFEFLLLPQFSIAILLVVSLAILTAGIHLDGLSDSFDALLSQRPKDEMLEIMRDHHTGVMGVLGMVCVLLLKIAFILALSGEFKFYGLFLMCILSRWAMVFLMFLFPYARTSGKAKTMIEGAKLRRIVFSSSLALIFSTIVSGYPALVIFVTLGAFVALAGRFITNRIGGITGDIIGAVSEISEVLVLFMVCVLERGYL